MIDATMQRIVFQSSDGGYSVAEFRTPEGEIIMATGAISMINPGETVKLSGEYQIHARFGRQLKVTDFLFTDPESLEAIEKYLGSGCVKGVGPVTAGRIVRTFRERTFEIMDTAPKRLVEVEGIGKAKMETIRTSWEEQRSLRTIMVFLQKHGISIAMATKIFHEYGMQAMEIIRENPYRMIRDIRGIGFSTADTIAVRAGIAPTDPNRLRAVILHVLHEARSDGNTALNIFALRERFASLCPDLPFPDDELAWLTAEGILVRESVEDEDLVAERDLAAAERRIVNRLKDIAETPFALQCGYRDEILKRALKGYPDLTAEQRQACESLFEHKLLILTGGPGTGKTTTLQLIIKAWKMVGAEIMLCAPTGRAANQVQEATGREASTIHRLLKFNGKGHVEYHANNPLPCHLLVVDETSMIDVPLFLMLLEALPPDARLLLVGDADQIPSVGPGNVLQDLIVSQRVPVIRLTRVFRQSSRSEIVQAAHDILAGEIPRSPESDGLAEFYFVNVEESERARAMILKLIRDRIPKRFGLDPVQDVQILAPMYKGECGVDRLNRMCQEELNQNTRHVMHRGVCLRLGDRVINLENDYDKMVYNGDCGVISGVDPTRRAVTVQLNGKGVLFEGEELDRLRLSYAITIHKSQGSEYPAVILPLLGEHYVMLRRNLLYTAVTRGRKLVVVVGSRRALQMAVKNGGDNRRTTLLQKYLVEALPCID